MIVQNPTDAFLDALNRKLFALVLGLIISIFVNSIYLYIGG